MSSSVLKVVFAYADATTKALEMGQFDPRDDAVLNFKTRLKKFNSVDEEEKKQMTNFETVLKSENGAALTGIKSATITTTQTRRIFDAATYKP